LTGGPVHPSFNSMDFEAERKRMVDEQLRRRGIRDRRVLAAMGTVPREAFVPDAQKDLAYRDGPLPIGEGQTISQPYVVALMTEALGLKDGEKVLEVGAGSGYAAAVLAEIADEVITLERREGLARKAAERLEKAGYANVRVEVADGTGGFAAEAPYDAISVTAGGPDVPASLKHQLKVGGHMVIPVGKGLMGTCKTRQRGPKPPSPKSLNGYSLPVILRGLLFLDAGQVH